MKKLIYPAVFEKEDVGYNVWFPNLEGCITQGDTLAEAYEMASEALALYLHGLKEYPIATDIENIEEPKGGKVMLVEPDENIEIVLVKKSELTNIIKDKRENLGFSKYRVAKILGISESYINRIESGERMPPPEIAKKIAALYDIEWTRFYD